MKDEGVIVAESEGLLVCVLKAMSINNWILNLKVLFIVYRYFAGVVD